MIITEPLNANEPDLLVGNENKDLLIYDLDEQFIHRQPPPVNGWTHASLAQFDLYYFAPFGWLAYLGSTDEWIGCSEV
ncbi:hypothetical protein I6M49_21560 [Shewanella algae]|uniref:hypothetical protein n=1 Tax=Shewanella algae TaxID=38313 RepID=UPI001AAC558A|nr:hypothetical protein [Shewanella algae]MBO2656034.1 hypothetical protein [Shewanella algae]